MSASTTRKIGGVLLKPDATPFANSSLTIYRDKREVVPQGDAAIVDEVLRTVTGPGGEVSMALVPGKYLGQIRLSDVDRYFQFTVPDGAGPFVIADLIETAPISGAQYLTLLDLVTTARAWAEKPEDEEVVENGYSALHWAAKAEEARAGAELAQSAAEGAQLAAEDAADRAEYAATVIENPVSYAPQTLSPAERSQARENIAALSYESQSLDSGQKEQARKNIGAGTVATLNLPEEQVGRVLDDRGQWVSPTSRAHITHIRDNPAFPGVVYDRIVISGGVGSLQMVPGKDLQPDGSIVPEEAKLSARRNGTRSVINASAFFNKGDGFYLPAGLYILDGVPYQEFSPTEPLAQEAIIMYRDGVLRPARMSDGKTAAQYVAEGALWSTGWGYLLVVDGAKTSLPSTSFTTQLSARTVLGQRANGDYVVLLVEGKTDSYGITLTQMQDLCINEGLVIAMNLDGGGTTQCWWDTAYAHPSSDDTPRTIGNYLTANVSQLNPYDTGGINLPLAAGVTAFGGIGVKVRQVNDDISIEVGVDVTPSIVNTAYTLITDQLPKRFWPSHGSLVRELLSGVQYRPIVLGMPGPMTSGQIYVRAVLDTPENSCQGTARYKAKWSG